MGFRAVGLLGSGVGNCHVCGHPYPPDRLFRFDGKLVCIFHRRDHTKAQLDANWQLANRLAKRWVIIEGMTPVEADGTPVPLPGGGGTGGGSGGSNDGDGEDPGAGTGGDGGGSGGDGDGGGTDEPPVGTITEDDYIDGGCE